MDAVGEAEKTEPDVKRPGKVRRWLDTLAAICKPAAAALEATGKVVSALGG